MCCFHFLDSSSAFPMSRNRRLHFNETLSVCLPVWRRTITNQSQPINSGSIRHKIKYFFSFPFFSRRVIWYTLSSPKDIWNNRDIAVPAVATAPIVVAAYRLFCIMRVSLVQIGYKVVDEQVNAVCITRNFEYTCCIWLDFTDQCGDTGLDNRQNVFFELTVLFIALFYATRGLTITHLGSDCKQIFVLLFSDQVLPIRLTQTIGCWYVAKVIQY